MKSSIALTILFFFNFVSAQDVLVQSPQSEQQSTTVIEVSKSKERVLRTPTHKVEVLEEDLEGEPANLILEARAKWKEACKNWKSEIKENNKDQQILSTNCGNPNCTRDAALSICRSKASAKVKIKIVEGN